KIEARCKALILDLTDVYHIDSAALVTFIDYYREAAQHGGVLCLCGVNEGLRPVFDTLKQGALLPIFATVADAVAALERREIQPYGTLSVMTDESSAIALRELARG
ncbi:MAG TPA: STAS domain-containing protein, partial [Chthoniobacterales bacterium]